MAELRRLSLGSSTFDLPVSGFFGVVARFVGIECQTLW